MAQLLSSQEVFCLNPAPSVLPASVLVYDIVTNSLVTKSWYLSRPVPAQALAVTRSAHPISTYFVIEKK